MKRGKVAEQRHWMRQRRRKGGFLEKYASRIVHSERKEKKFIEGCVISWLMILTQEKEGRKKVKKGKRKGKYRKNGVHIMVKKRKGIEMRSDF